MITVRFFKQDSLLRGFEMKGHAGCGEAGQDILCAAVSSAAFMVVNTATDILHCEAQVKGGDVGYLYFLSDAPDENVSVLLQGLELHLRGLREEYPGKIKCIYGGTKNA